MSARPDTNEAAIAARDLTMVVKRLKSNKEGHLRIIASGLIVEAAGIAPASREASVRASTCVADRLIVGLGAPVGRVSFGLSCHGFNPGRNKRFGSGDPELSSPAESLGRRPGARPLLWFRQRDGTAARKCRQLSFGRLFTRPADQPRHAAVHLGHPVDPGSPPNGQGYSRARSYYTVTLADVHTRSGNSRGISDHRRRVARSMSRLASCFLIASRLS